MNSLTYLTVESSIREQIEKLARMTGKPEKVVLREVVKAGLKTYTQIPTKSAQAALDLIE
jgi:predicted DNA-binding protein